LAGGFFFADADSSGGGQISMSASPRRPPLPDKKKFVMSNICRTFASS
jgi:hypothetical protein